MYAAACLFLIPSCKTLNRLCLYYLLMINEGIYDATDVAKV